VSYGNYGFIQAKSSITGPLGKKFAGRISFSGTQRDGVLYNVATGKSLNDLNNLGVRAQLLFTPSDKVKILLIGDATDQNPDGYAQVVAGVAPTLRPGYRQFEQIIADLNYDLPSRNPFDRVVDHNTSWRSGNELGGVSLNVDAELGPGTLTATTAWRYWNWDPSNDRDFTALPVLSLSQATSKHQQWTQEVRYAGDLSSRLGGVIGVFAIGQDLKTDPYHIEESGAAQWRFSQSSTSPLWQTPGLFDRLRHPDDLAAPDLRGGRVRPARLGHYQKFTPAARPALQLRPEEVDFNRQTYGGLETADPALLALKRVVYTDQAFTADVDESNLSGQLTLTYNPAPNVNSFATYSTSYKPVGVNLGGLPTANGEVMTELARVKPEYVNHLEVGVKTTPTANATLNVVFHNTDIRDYQTQVQTAEVGVNRATSPTPNGYACSASNWTATSGWEGTFPSTVRWPTPTASTYRSPTRRCRWKKRAGNLPSRTFRAATCRASPSGPAPSVVNWFPTRATCSGNTASSSSPSTPTPVLRSRRAPRPPGTSTSAATPWSTAGPASGPRRACRCSCGAATCSTATTSNNSCPLPATPVTSPASSVTPGRTG
jgi:iron complex outermembrane receptor protein